MKLGLKRTMAGLRRWWHRAVLEHQQIAWYAPGGETVGFCTTCGGWVSTWDSRRGPHG